MLQQGAREPGNHPQSDALLQAERASAAAAAGGSGSSSIAVYEPPARLGLCWEDDRHDFPG